jgi:hypothetical protein
MAVFNATDDASFRNLTSQGILATINPLASLQPSSFDFTTGCVAALDIANRNASTNVTTSEEQLAIGTAVLLLVPLNFTTATVFDAISYWHALSLLPSTRGVLQDALRTCQSSGKTAIPLSQLDFTNNCSATSNFWWQFVAPDPSVRNSIQSSDALELFLPAVPANASSFSNATIMTALGLQAASPAVAALVNEAADVCTSEACKNLSYQGNSDIGGLGAVICYASIALFTTIVCAVCSYYYRKDDGVVEMSTAARRAAVKSSLNFSDTVTYFAIMTALASDIYIYSSDTLYEFSLAAMVGSMAFAACSLLSLVNLFPMEAEDAKVRDFSRWIALTIAQNVSIPAISRLNNLSQLLIKYVDMPCYGSNVWPTPLIYTGSCMVIIAWLPYTILIANVSLRQYYEKNERPVPRILRKSSPFNRICLYLGIAISFAILWYSVVAIIYIRERSRRAFGSSFEDDNFGFGQIIASGFVLQVIVQYAMIRTCEYLELRANVIVTNCDAGSHRSKQSVQHITNLAAFNRRETKLSRMTDESRTVLESGCIIRPSHDEELFRLGASRTEESNKTIK